MLCHLVYSKWSLLWIFTLTYLPWPYESSYAWYLHTDIPFDSHLLPAPENNQHPILVLYSTGAISVSPDGKYIPGMYERIYYPLFVAKSASLAYLSDAYTHIIRSCLTLGWSLVDFMITSSNGNIFRVTGPLCGEFTGHRWIPLTKANDAEHWCVFELRLE